MIYSAQELFKCDIESWIELKVSVIMPVYNEAKNLSKSIESILNQTMKDFEFIIVNDIGSIDGSSEIIQDYAQKDQRVIFIQKKTGCRGVAASLNLGLHAAKGQYIARMDADDYSYPERFYKQVNFLDKNSDVVLCGSNYRVVTPAKKWVTSMEIHDDAIRAKLLFGSTFGHPTVMFRRAIFEQRQWYYDENVIVEDYELWMRVVSKGKVANLPDVLLDYYTGFGSNVSDGKNVTFQKAACELIKVQLQNKLGIKIESYLDDVFYLGYIPVNFRKTLLMDVLRLYEEIEMRNKLIRYCNPFILAQLLVQYWNQYVQMYMGTESEYILSFRSGSLFIDMILAWNVDNRGTLKTLMEAYFEGGNSILTTGKKIIVFGTGKISCDYMKQYNEKITNQLVCFCDNDPKKRGSIFFEKKVISPRDLVDIEYDFIFIATNKHYQDIRRQLISECNIQKEKIKAIQLLNLLN